MPTKPRIEYLDLAKGMLPGGVVDEAFAAKGDSDNDGMLDYWERIYGIDTQSYKDAVADPDRDGGIVCVVEDARDVMAMERVRDYRGTYHVLGGALSPMNGIGPDSLHIKELLDRLETEEIREVILATNPTVEGEATAMYLARLLSPYSVKVTRLAYGIPVGGDLEYADEVTLHRAMTGRQTID